MANPKVFSPMKSRASKELMQALNPTLLEQYGSDYETGSDVLEFAKAYASLGRAVQEQVDQVVSAYTNFGPNSDAFMDAAVDVNPNAINLALKRLQLPARGLGETADDVIDALSEVLHGAMDSERG